MTIRIDSQPGEIPLRLTATRMGEDLCVCLSGGDRPHIGALALAQPHLSAADSTRLSASTSVITVCGHKEDRLACDMATRVAIATHARVSVACGIHIAAATPEEISQACEIAERLISELLEQLAFTPS